MNSTTTSALNTTRGAAFENARAMTPPHGPTTPVTDRVVVGRLAERPIPSQSSGDRLRTVRRDKGYLRDTTVDEVRTRADRRAFVELPWQIYRDDPHWVPPLRREVHAFIDRRKHPFYQHGEAVQFLARRDNQVVGRILVSDDPNYNEQYGANLGCFGMFECIDDQRVADDLLHAAAAWLKQRGRTHVLGPIDYSTNYPCGLLIKGFDTGMSRSLLKLLMVSLLKS